MAFLLISLTAGLAHAVTVATYTVVVALVVLSTGSMMGARISWGGATDAAYDAVTAPVLSATKAIRGDTIAFVIAEATEWANMWPRDTSTAVNRTPLPPERQPGLKNMTPGQRYRCDKLKENIRPNTTAWCDSNSTSPIDGYLAARNTMMWKVIRVAYAIVLGLLLWAARWQLVRLTYWVVVCQIWGTLCFVTHDLLTRGNSFRNGQQHAYSGAPTGTASVLYFIFDMIFSLCRVLTTGSLFFPGDAQRVLTTHFREPEIEAPPAGRKGWQRVGAGDARSDLDRALAHARLQGYTLQQAAMARDAMKANAAAESAYARLKLPASLESVAAVNHTAGLFISRVGVATGDFFVAKVHAYIGPKTAPTAELASVWLTLAKSTVGHHPFMNVQPYDAVVAPASKPTFRLQYPEFATLQVVVETKSGPKQICVPEFTDFTDADFAAVSNAPTAYINQARQPSDDSQLIDELKKHFTDNIRSMIPTAAEIAAAMTANAAAANAVTPAANAATPAAPSAPAPKPAAKGAVR
jgi:hypothetical protein